MHLISGLEASRAFDPPTGNEIMDIIVIKKHSATGHDEVGSF